MESLLLADVQIPLTRDIEAWHKADSLFGILTTRSDEVAEVGVVVVLVLDVEKYRILNKRMRDRFHDSIDLSASTITVVLNNDERKAKEYSVGGVFLDGQPVEAIEYAKSWFTLEHRHKVDITFSNVGAAHLAKHGNVVALVFKDTA